MLTLWEGERMAATAHWTAADTDFPANGSPRDKLGFAVKVATLGSVVGTGQPSWFRITDQFVELSARAQLTGHDSDSAEREAMIYCGTALQHLKLALRRHGSLGRVDLFPDLDQPLLAARVHVGCGAARDSYEQQLFDALEVGKASSPRLELPASDSAFEFLNRAGTGDRGWLEFARSDSSRQRLLELAQAGTRVQLKEIRFQNETLARSPDGAWESAGFTGTTLHERFSRWRKPALVAKSAPAIASIPDTRSASESALRNGSFAVLKTKTDNKHGWLAAGQLLARLLLHARVLGLACTPHIAVLQNPALRAELRTAIGHKGFTQVILCFATRQIKRAAQSDPIYPRTVTVNSA